jgi:hypothetical protein
VPLGIAGLALTRRLVPDLRAQGSGPPPADWRGFALTATGIAALVLVLENIGTGEMAWAAVLVGVAVSASALAAAAVHLLRAPLPLLDLRVLRIASFRATVA